jgi:hypothetical protein
MFADKDGEVIFESSLRSRRSYAAALQRRADAQVKS